MGTFQRRLGILALFSAFLLLEALPAQAQATRTWVSGVGDDVNPCSRTAPCKTFAGAISKTAINGEIDVLDPGGFGTVTITKSMTLDGTYGSGFGSILASGTIGITINIPSSATDTLRTVRIRNLSINGTGSNARTGTKGIRIISAANVYIENTLITDFNSRGISDERTTGGELFITDTIVRNSANGIVIFPSSGSTRINAFLDNVRVEGNDDAGVITSSGSRLVARNTSAVGNNIGFYTDQPAGAVEANLENCAAFNNTIGVQNGPGASITRLSNCVIWNNGTGVNPVAGQLLSYGNNKIGGNTAGNTGVAAAVPGQQ